MKLLLVSLGLLELCLAIPQHTYTSCDIVRAWPCASTFRDNEDCATYLPTSLIVYPTRTSTVQVLESTPAVYPYTVRTNAQWPAVTTTATSLTPGPTAETTMLYTHSLPASLSVCNDLYTLASVCSCRGLYTYNTTTTVTPYTTTTVTVPGTMTTTATRTQINEACQAADNYGYAPTSISWFYDNHLPWTFAEEVESDIDTAARCCEACYDPANPNNGCNYYRWDHNGTLDNGGTCYLGIWNAGDEPSCYNSDPRQYPGPDAGSRSGQSNDSQFGFGPCLKEQPCYYDFSAPTHTCPY